MHKGESRGCVKNERLGTKEWGKRRTRFSVEGARVYLQTFYRIELIG